jgi:dGTPase
VPIFAAQRREVERATRGWPGAELIHETVRRMINLMVIDLIDRPRENIAGGSGRDRSTTFGPRRASWPIQSQSCCPEQRELKGFLRDKLYRHYQVAAHDRQGPPHRPGAVRRLHERPPPSCRRSTSRWPRSDKPRAIADYIAGMTDRYAMKEHRRLFAVGEMLLIDFASNACSAAGLKDANDVRRYIQASPNVFERSPRRDHPSSRPAVSRCRRA